MDATRKVFTDLAISIDGLGRIEALADEIGRLQAALRDALHSELAQIEEEGPLSAAEWRKIQSALSADLALTGVTINSIEL